MFINPFKKIAVIGMGGVAKELTCNLKKNSFEYFVHMEHIKKFNLINVNPIENLDTSKYKILIAIGDPNIRNKIVKEFPDNTEYYTYIDKRAVILDKKTVKIGKGSIITAGCILTSNVNIGNFSYLNLNTTISHDSTVGEFCTTTPGVHITGNTKIGSRCYFGSGSIVRNKIQICDDVIVGMNGVVAKNITEPGVYVGVPVVKIK